MTSARRIHNPQLRQQIELELKQVLADSRADLVAVIARRHPDYVRCLSLLIDLADDRGVSGHAPGHSVTYTGSEFLVALIQGQLGVPRL